MALPSPKSSNADPYEIEKPKAKTKALKKAFSDSAFLFKNIGKKVVYVNGRPVKASKVKTDGTDTLLELSSNEMGRELFLQFLHSEHSEENFLFWEEVTCFKLLPDEAIGRMEDDADRIYRKYVARDSPLEINIPGKVKDSLHSVFLCNASLTAKTFPAFEPISRDVFDPAQHEVFKTLREDSLVRFMKTPLYAKYKKRGNEWMY
eukprot:TRINITY_DN3476_c0_g1_i2.p1 TRINITY_DN3476_c0_g1~~TRINITY_DN3476_c0_g1_i2.p1  ORF type:complete len:205 (-),score=26.33 TRINITY_DN3476_c0_g1_i2:110-724(-)